MRRLLFLASLALIAASVWLTAPLTESHRGLSVAYRSLKRARRLSVGLLGILLLGAMAVAGALG
ncbi:MAG: hypothetical protein LC737_05430, partial [Chloroflexi bacterium]|nr:hypothetical protein [Chloroflexota bacterium]